MTQTISVLETVSTRHLWLPTATTTRDVSVPKPAPVMVRRVPPKREPRIGASPVTFNVTVMVTSTDLRHYMREQLTWKLEEGG